MSMYLNTLKPANGAKFKKIRCGRGIGCGRGKTCGHGHKGQTARSGYSRKMGFEGGQTPFQRRIPKFGFRSRLSSMQAEVSIGDLLKINCDRIGIVELKEAHVIKRDVRKVKIILSGTFDKVVTLYGVAVTKGVRNVIESLGGKIEE